MQQRLHLSCHSNAVIQLLMAMTNTKIGFFVSSFWSTVRDLKNDFHADAFKDVSLDDCSLLLSLVYTCNFLRLHPKSATISVNDVEETLQTSLGWRGDLPWCVLQKMKLERVWRCVFDALGRRRVLFNIHSEYGILTFAQRQILMKKRNILTWIIIFYHFLCD